MARPAGVHGNRLGFIHPHIQEGIGTFKRSEETDLIYHAFQFRKSVAHTNTLAPVARLTGFYRIRKDLTTSADIPVSMGENRYDLNSPNIMIGLSYRPFFALINLNTTVLYNPEFGFRWLFGIAGNFGKGNTFMSISTNDVITLLRNKENPLSSLTIAKLSQRF